MHKIWMLALFLFSAGCITPRVMNHSGRVVPRGEVRGGANYVFNYSSQTASALFEGLDAGVDALVGSHEVHYDASLKSLAEAAIAYSIDPIGSGFDLFLRYGFYDRFDAGYRYTFSNHAFDLRWQFLGPLDDDESLDRVFGSVGFQFARVKYDLPGFLKLDLLQDLLGYEITRYDLLLPVAFSYSFGPQERFGAVSLGGVVGLSHLNYGFEPLKIVEPYVADAGTMSIRPIHARRTIPTYGTFLHVKAGYDFVYLAMSAALYYQSYGRFDLLDGESVAMSGWTVVPGMGVEVNYDLWGAMK